jgi:hypothetical protein
MKFSLELVARLQPVGTRQANVLGPSARPSKNTSDTLEAQIFS